MNRTQWLLLLLSAGCLTACGKDAPPAAPTAVQGATAISLEGTLPATDIGRMMQVITELSADEYGGRAPMSSGEKLTLTFIEQQFRSIGLQPLFGDSFRQPVDIISIQADPATANMTFHLKNSDRPVAYADEMVVATQRAIPESRVENSEVVFVGYGIVAPEYAWNDYADVDVTGKTVLILNGQDGREYRLNVKEGLSCSFRQQAVVIDDTTKEFIPLGDVSKTAVVTPDVETAFIETR